VDNVPATFGHYEIVALLGHGTSGTVYQARDGKLNRVIALKVPDLEPASERSLRVAWFLHEARVLAFLTGTPTGDIPPLFEVGEYHELPYYAREFVEGSDLEQLAAGGSLDLASGVRTVQTVAEIVQSVHQRHVAHRNLHPSNVLVATDGSVKLIGFGRCGLLEGSPVLPPDRPGVPPTLDVRGLQDLLGWLFATLRQPVPAVLESLLQPGAVASAGAFAEALAACLRAGFSTVPSAVPESGTPVGTSRPPPRLNL
jgi:serine/threonine protein kinase